MSSRCCVVICYWAGRAPRALYRLLRQMQSIPAGEPFDTLIVVNGGDQRPLALPPEFASLEARVLNRPNSGWNLGAWEAGRRSAPGYDYTLFLQSECVLRQPGWLGRFVRRMEIDPGIGLLGEKLMWQNMTWDYARAATQLDLEERGQPVPTGLLETIDTYRRLLKERGVEPGDIGTHLVSVILFSRREVLEQVGGILTLGDTYAEAVASEIGTSRRIANAGWRLSQIADEPFTRIAHPQWAPPTAVMRLRDRVLDKFDRAFGWR